MLLLHGFGISYNIWKEIVPSLEKRYKLIIPEMPGIGQSAIPDSDAPYLEFCVTEIECLRRELGYDRWSLVSYSSGTQVAERYLALHECCVKRVVFICPVIAVNWHRYALRLFRNLDEQNPRLGDCILSGWRLYALIRILAFNGQNHPLVSEWAREISLQDTNILKQSLFELANTNSGLSQLRVPYLIIWAASDLISPQPSHLCEHHRSVDAPHAAPLLVPGAISNRVSSFLANDVNDQFA